MDNIFYPQILFKDYDLIENYPLGRCKADVGYYCKVIDTKVINGEKMTLICPLESNDKYWVSSSKIEML